MINTTNFDFNQRFMVGQGTGFLATLDTVEDVTAFFSTLDVLTRHFCKLYDREKLQLAEGWEVSWWISNGRPIGWREW